MRPTELSALADAPLVTAIGRFSQEALGEAYRRHSGAVHGLARRLLRDDTLAEEITQEVFLRLWNDPEKFDAGRGSLRSFLLAHTHGRSIDLIRSESARRTREDKDARLDPGLGQDVEEEVWDMALAESIQGALSTLGEGERRPIELAYFGGHSYREVAEILGEPEGTVKSRIRSGLKRLRVSLDAAGVSNA
ncbi:MAG: sigma-70 family RNA polymerase sigma factor [Acidimicrobiia bacterium]|nr:sigma-70 family RNA polymerase sigma factor [Acidimicrobiia bacterium]